MTTSAADPEKARKQRQETLQEDEFLQEREWIPLWLAGPVLGLGGVLGIIALLMALAAWVEWLQKVTQ